nr:phosphatidylserine decarboxylase family protein [Oceanusvirus sp.]
MYQTDMKTYITHAPEAFAIVFVILCLRMYKLAAVVALVFVAFYRGGRVNMGTSDDMVYSPCNGKVSAVRTDSETGRRFVSVFLNLHNVHVQYVPVDGVVESVRHTPGTFHPAYMFEKSSFNERTETVIRAQNQDRITVTQIAGQVARRIKTFANPGDRVSKGDPLGLIKFGSRVDITAPPSATPVVSVGDAVDIGDVLFSLRQGHGHTDSFADSFGTGM